MGVAMAQLAAKTTATANICGSIPASRATPMAMGVNNTAVALALMMLAITAVNKKNTDKITAGLAPLMAMVNCWARYCAPPVSCMAAPMARAAGIMVRILESSARDACCKFNAPDKTMSTAPIKAAATTGSKPVAARTTTPKKISPARMAW